MSSALGLEFPERCYSTSGLYAQDPVRDAAPVHGLTFSLIPNPQL